MDKIDLIIDALEKAKDGWQSFDEYANALAAARELKALKPVAWVGLTDDDMDSLVTQARKVPVEIPCDSFTTRLLKLAEQILKEKNDA